jgi:hypothetical protein
MMMKVTMATFDKKGKRPRQNFQVDSIVHVNAIMNISNTVYLDTSRQGLRAKGGV